MSCMHGFTMTMSRSYNTSWEDQDEQLLSSQVRGREVNHGHPPDANSLVDTAGPESLITGTTGGDHIKKPEAQKEMLAAVPSASRII